MKRAIKYFVLNIFFLSLHGGSNTITEHNANEIRPIVEMIQSLAFYQQLATSKTPFCVGIGGCSGVGKTDLAHALVTLLAGMNTKAIVVPLDNFIDPDYYDKRNGFHLHFNHRAAHSALEKITSGEKQITISAWDWDPNKKDILPSKQQKKLDFTDAHVVILEGEFALDSQEPYNFFQYIGLGIDLDASPEHVLEWNFSRGRDAKDGSLKEFNENHLESLLKYQRYMKPARARFRGSTALIYSILKDSDHKYKLV